MIDVSVENLIVYAKTHLLLDEMDEIYVRNAVLDLLGVDSFTQYEVDEEAIENMNCPDEVIAPILAYAKDKGIVKEGEEVYFATKLMGLVSLKPSEMIYMFEDLHAQSPAKAFDFLYDYSVKNDYVKLTAISKNKHWEAKSTKGKLEITINLSKPEKSNKETAKLVGQKASTYPACAICKENVGFAGHGTYRQNIRTIPLELGGEEWFWQFSPYAYFTQHGICINAEHTPMKVTPQTVVKLLDFVDYAPQYFVGCNASLPIVGGSILTHDHFQGGLKQLPMHKAAPLARYKNPEYPYVDTYVLDWYNSVIRLVSDNKKQIAEYAGKIIDAWQAYTDESVQVIAADENGQHNAITPVARKADGKYVVEIILRNNLTTEQYPDGVYHVHPEYQHIKSESIGLIEAMGLFILPGRLDRQLKQVEAFLSGVTFNEKALDEDMKPFAKMIKKLIKENGSACSAVEAALAVKDEVNDVCEHILDNTAVFKKDEQGVAAFDAFLASVGIKRA